MAKRIQIQVATPAAASPALARESPRAALTQRLDGIDARHRSINLEGLRTVNACQVEMVKQHGVVTELIDFVRELLAE